MTEMTNIKNPASRQLLATTDSCLTIAGRRFRSRLFMGTAKYPDFKTLTRALSASEAEGITVAVRRINLNDKKRESLLDYIDSKKYFIIPNTAGCYSLDEALRTARLGKAAGFSNWIKLEVISDPDTLLPDALGTLSACKELVKEGFIVLAYISDDPVMAKKLEEAGASAVMPLGAPIGSGQGILNPNNIRMILDKARVPIIVDAGVGTASDVTIAMELGVDGVLLNSGIALARKPVKMAEAMAHAIKAGRLAFLAGRMTKRIYAAASSPSDGMIS